MVSPLRAGESKERRSRVKIAELVHHIGVLKGGGANRKNLFGMRPERKALVLGNAHLGKYHGVG